MHSGLVGGQEFLSLGGCWAGEQFQVSTSAPLGDFVPPSPRPGQGQERLAARQRKGGIRMGGGEGREAEPPPPLLSPQVGYLVYVHIGAGGRSPHAG